MNANEKWKMLASLYGYAPKAAQPQVVHPMIQKLGESMGVLQPVVPPFQDHPDVIAARATATKLVSDAGGDVKQMAGFISEHAEEVRARIEAAEKAKT